MSGHSFTRQELYALVWAEPMITLGARYGISGNGLAKACRRADIPVPERGYWAKLQAGHKTQKTPLPPATVNTQTHVTIHPPIRRRIMAEPTPVDASVQEKVDSARKFGGAITVPATLSNPHRIVESWLQDDRRERRERRRLDSWLPLRKAIDETELDKRRLRILSALFKALEARGYKLAGGDTRYNNVRISLGQENLEIQLEERIQQVRRQINDEDRAKHSYFSRDQKWTQEKVPTGELVLKIKEESRYGIAKEWRETKSEPLEDKLNDVIAQVAGMFEELRLRRLREAEEQQRRRKIEEERRQSQMEHKRQTIRFNRLLDCCKDWRTAAEIRAFVAAVEASPRATSDVEQFATWKNWALGHADRIDPLCSDGLFDQKVSDYEVYTFRD